VAAQRSTVSRCAVRATIVQQERSPSCDRRHTWSGTSPARWRDRADRGKLILPEGAEKPALGSSVECATPHCDPTVNLYIPRWTDDEYLSTKHRVINTHDRDRYSIPCFFGPSADAVIEVGADLPGARPPAVV
jgi:hypothetical protein